MPWSTRQPIKKPTPPGEDGGGTDLHVGVLPGAQSAHPEVGEDDLAAGVREEGAVVGGHGEAEARLPAPVLQLARQHLLRLVVVRAVAEVQQLQRCGRTGSNTI